MTRDTLPVSPVTIRSEIVVSSSGQSAQTQPRRTEVVSRYTRIVLTLKYLLPSLAAALIILVILWPQISGYAIKGLPIVFAPFDSNSVMTQTLIQAYYHNVDSSNRPYVLSTDRAEETEPGSQTVALTNPKIDIALDQDTRLMMGADQGLYQQQDKRLELQGDVTLFHNGGYTMRTDSIRIDMATMVAVGEQPVSGQGLFGNLHSEGVSIVDAGKSVTFTGKARLILFPNSPMTVSLHPEMKSGSVKTSLAPSDGRHSLK